MSALPEEDPVPPPSSKDAGKSERPDWLVGAEEGLQAELESNPHASSAPVLGRPTDALGPPGEAPPPPARPVLHRPDAGAAPPPQRRLPELDDARLQTAGWVPRLEITTELKPSAAPVDRVEPAAAAGPDLARGHDPFLDDPAARTLRRGEFPDADRTPMMEIELEPAPAARPAIQEMAIEFARRSWKWAAAAAGAVVVGATIAHALGIGTTPIRQVLRDPALYDGRNIRVRGRVSQDVYNVGGSYTFYLLQGRDSLVVFTRFRIPHPKEGVELSAQVSTGTLDDALRPALLEVEPARKK